ncbi:hypothetical protein GOBAR_AA11324 [Gossypium barbadense]|uniref:Uncharacterized protein n=1 Tax=Gossypium barbadense TaxID=3634 RepID=A0A2P5Y1A2_GOSBA|nr:hypothetical protein GOBAR_AA11324 [Gossypium barbadense]
MELHLMSELHTIQILKVEMIIKKFKLRVNSWLIQGQEDLMYKMEMIPLPLLESGKNPRKFERFPRIPSYQKPMMLLVWNCKGAHHLNFMKTMREMVRQHNLQG